MICEETYYPMWSSRGIRGVRCKHPAKFITIDHDAKVLHLCGIHARRYRGNFPERTIERIEASK